MPWRVQEAIMQASATLMGYIRGENEKGRAGPGGARGWLVLQPQVLKAGCGIEASPDILGGSRNPLLLKAAEG